MTTIVCRFLYSNASHPHILNYIDTFSTPGLGNKKAGVCATPGRLGCVPRQEGWGACHARKDGMRAKPGRLECVALQEGWVRASRGRLGCRARKAEVPRQEGLGAMPGKSSCICILDANAPHSDLINLASASLLTRSMPHSF